jgi:hypothetical protein
MIKKLLLLSIVSIGYAQEELPTLRRLPTLTPLQESRKAHHDAILPRELHPKVVPKRNKHF